MRWLTQQPKERERCAWRCQAKSEDQKRQHKEEWERMCARIAALEAELVVCGRPSLKHIRLQARARPEGPK